jgi:hypothetical protein
MSRAQLTSTVEQNTGGAVSPFLAGKNKIINGDFGVWQRGTSFTPSAGVNNYTADRFWNSRDGSGATVTISQQAFTPGSAPVAGYESAYFYRYAQSVAGSGGTYVNFLIQRIEDVRLFAGQTVTVSFWAKADSARSIALNPYQEFGSGGSGAVGVASVGFNLTTSWTRYTATFPVPSISGKTIGTGSSFTLFFALGSANTVQTIDMWGIQAEAGSVATPFTTASNTVQGELALCQRYYQRLTNGSSNYIIGAGNIYTSSEAHAVVQLPVTMRIAPSVAASATNILTVWQGGGAAYSSGVSSYGIGQSSFELIITVSGMTAGQGATTMIDGGRVSGAYLEMAAEL